VSLYIGQLVVLKSRWNIHSSRLGIIIAEEEPPSDVVLVMWIDDTTNGVKLKYHLKDAVLPITDETIGKIKERKFEL
jgi:hypothetical protein